MVPVSGDISEVLLVNFLAGLGDGLYVNGLLHYLTSCGVKVQIATLPKLKVIHQTVLSEENIHNVLDSETRSQLASHNWDVVLDLSGSVWSKWDARVDLLMKLKSPVIGIDKLIRNNHLACSEYIDVTNCAHIGSRWAKLANRITGQDITLIPPYVGLHPQKREERYIYVNTAGSCHHRTLSSEQIGWISEVLNKERILGLFYAPQNIQIKESAFVKRISPFSFAEACRLVGGAIGVITPDTSIAHVASAYERPQLTFFPGNTWDFLGFPTSEEFTPLGKYIIVKPKRKPRLAKEIVPISAITKEELGTALQEFFAMLSP